MPSKKLTFRQALFSRTKTLLPFILSILLPLLGSLFLYFQWGATKWIHTLFHSAIEAFGASIALIVAAVLLFKHRSKNVSPHFLWVSLALICMGILDFFHAFVEQSPAFYWSRTLANLFGGLLFLCAWLPDRMASPRAFKNLPSIIGILSLLLGLFFILDPNALPIMYSPTGYSMSAKFINFIGGTAFLLATWNYLLRYAKTRRQEDYLFSLQCMVFGMAGVLFAFSSIWNSVWWYFHILRLLAYILVIKYIFQTYQETIEQVESRLSATESRFRSIVENMSEGLMLFDPGMNLTYQNPASLRIHQMDPEKKLELERNTLHETWIGEDEDGRELSFDEWPLMRAFQGEKVKDMILHVKEITRGVDFFGSYNASPVYDSEGKIAMAFLTIRDITSERTTRVRTEALQKLTEALSKTSHLPDVVEVAINHGGAAVGATTGAVCLLVEDGSAFELIAGPGISAQLSSEWKRFPRESQLTGSQAVSTRLPCYSRTRAEYIARDPRFAAVAEAQGIEAEATLPLMIGENVFGVLTFLFSKPQSFNRDEDLYLRTVAEQCAQAMERARLFEAEREAVNTLSKLNAEVLASAERIQLALAAGAIVGTWDWDLTTDRFTVDEQFAENFGIDPSLGRIGLSLEQVIATVHPDDLAGLQVAIAEAIARGGPYSHEYRVRGLDGVYRWIQANGRVDHGPDGTPLRFPGVLLDVEKRRDLEAERDRAMQLLRAFIDAVPGVVYAKDLNGRMLVANKGATDLIGKPPEAYLGKTDMEYLDRKDQAEAIMANDKRIMESGQQEIVEEEINFADGSRAVWLSTKAPFRDANGKVIGLIGSSVDITSRKEFEAILNQRTNELAQAQHRLESALKSRDDFLSIASHELKTPISSLKLHAQMAKRSREKGDPQTYAPERMNKLIDQTDKQVERLTRLVDDMLDISRIQEGRLSIQKKPLNICMVIEEAIERLKLNLNEANTPATFECEEQFEIEGDKIRLEQVVINLLTNAIRYGKQRSIYIELARSKSNPEFVRISVRDQGMGISSDAKERIFGRFEREVNPNEVSGLGLGLFISKQIVESHGGKIWVESAGIDQGSTFFVELPLKS